MRASRVWPAVLTALGLWSTGCVIQQSGSGDDYSGGGGYDPGWGTGTGGSGGSTGYGCHADSECGGAGYVCARDGECLTASSVHIIHVNWTVRQQPTSTATCSGAPNLDITFSDIDNNTFGFSPVPCVEGRFTVDKLPTWYSKVNLERAGDYNGGANGAFDAQGNASLDLPY